MKTQIIAAVWVIGGSAFLLLAVSLVFSSIRKKMKAHIRERFDKNEIIGSTTSVNFFGEQSKGGKQIRGNGALVLTKDELFFIRAMPFKEYVIPIKSITGVSTPTSFNGRSSLSRLLCVQYKTDSGADAIAWSIKEPGKWKEAIEMVMVRGCYVPVNGEQEK